MSIISKESAERYFWGENCSGWHLVKAPGLSIIQEEVPPGSFEIKHYHARSEQFFYILNGLATFEIDDQRFELGPGQGIHIPAGSLHQLKNVSDCMLEFIVTSVPPSHGDRFPV